MSSRRKKIAIWVVLVLILGVLITVLTHFGSGHSKSPNHVPAVTQTTSG